MINSSQSMVCRFLQLRKAIWVIPHSLETRMCMSPLVDPPMSLIRVVLWEMLVLDVPRRTEILILDLPINFVPVVGQELAQEAAPRALTPIVFLNVSAVGYRKVPLGAGDNIDPCPDFYFRCRKVMRSLSKRATRVVQTTAEPAVPSYSTLFCQPMLNPWLFWTSTMTLRLPLQ